MVEFICSQLSKLLNWQQLLQNEKAYNNDNKWVIGMLSHVFPEVDVKS